MAIREVTAVSFDSQAASFTWGALMRNQIGAAIELPEHFDRLEFEVFGEFDGAEVGVEMSKKGDAFGPVRSPIREVMAGEINARPAWIRPAVIGGGKRTLLSCVVRALAPAGGRA